MVLQDGAFHAVDSSELAFRLAAIGAFREVYNKTKPVILEPIMNVEVVAPLEFQSAVIGGLNSRRGTIVDTEVREDEFTCLAEVALNDMFGYSNQLRGGTQGKGEFSMEYKVSWLLSCFFQASLTAGSRHICRFYPTSRRSWRMLTRKPYPRPKSRLRQ